MDIGFVPPHGLPVLLDDVPRTTWREHHWPSGWWIIPAMIVGFVECAALIGWFIA
jgi:hypothetical protein